MQTKVRYTIGSADVTIAPEWEELARRAEFKPSQLAERTGVSLRTLQRRFHAQFGLTVGEWLTSIRLRQASNRIRAGERVKQVAHDLGYKQLSHFSREFKRAFGAAPSEARAKQMRIRISLGVRKDANHILNSGPR